MKILKNSFINNSSSIILRLTVALSIVVMFISVGFAALTSTLSINGSAKFVPVGMIRVMSIEQNTLTNATEVDSSYTKDTINVQVDINDINGYAIYDVNITNLGQTDKVLTQIVDQIFSNNDMEYEITGLAIDDVIEAGDSIDFQIKFKYKDNVSNPDSRLNSSIQFIFDDYVDVSTFPIVFEQVGACTFNGENGNITGNDCSDYWNKNHIDTGIYLYNNDNWEKDYEIGFTVESYNSNSNVSQATFVNTKYENDSLKWPGLVVRKATNNIEVTQSINNGNKVTKTFSVPSTPFTVKVMRIDGVIYYSLNGGTLVQVQNMSNFNQQFNVTTWFGAASDANGSPMRLLNATLSNMYIKLGEYEVVKHTITFDANGGTVSEQTREVSEGMAVGTLPIPTNSDDTLQFFGWYSDSNFTTLVNENTLVTSDATYHAKWVLKDKIRIGNTFYSTIAAALADVPTDGSETTIQMLDDVVEHVTISAGMNVVIDLGSHTISNSNTTAIFTNDGTLKLTNGTILSTTTEGAINNNASKVLVVDGVTLTATGAKQAIYNNGGTLTITGNSNISNTSTIRAAVHNLGNGTLYVESGTITANNHAGINCENGTMVIGTEGGGVDISNPVIAGKTYGITSSVNYELYDGIIKGKTNAVNNDTKITQFESGYQKTTGTDGDYHTLYLQ